MKITEVKRKSNGEYPLLRLKANSSLENCDTITAGYIFRPQLIENDRHSDDVVAVTFVVLHEHVKQCKAVDTCQWFDDKGVACLNMFEANGFRVKDEIGYRDMFYITEEEDCFELFEEEKIRFDFDHENGIVKVNRFTRDELGHETSKVVANYAFKEAKNIFEMRYVDGENKYFQKVSNLLKIYRDVKNGFHWNTKEETF